MGRLIDMKHKGSELIMHYHDYGLLGDQVGWVDILSRVPSDISIAATHLVVP